MAPAAPQQLSVRPTMPTAAGGANISVSLGVWTQPEVGMPAPPAQAPPPHMQPQPLQPIGQTLVTPVQAPPEQIPALVTARQMLEEQLQAGGPNLPLSGCSSGKASSINDCDLAAFQLTQLVNRQQQGQQQGQQSGQQSAPAQGHLQAQPHVGKSPMPVRQLMFRVESGMQHPQQHVAQPAAPMPGATLHPEQQQHPERLQPPASCLQPAPYPALALVPHAQQALQRQAVMQASSEPWQCDAGPSAAAGAAPMHVAGWRPPSAAVLPSMGIGQQQQGGLAADVSNAGFQAQRSTMPVHAPPPVPGSAAPASSNAGTGGAMPGPDAAVASAAAAGAPAAAGSAAPGGAVPPAAAAAVAAAAEQPHKLVSMLSAPPAACMPAPASSAAGAATPGNAEDDIEGEYLDMKTYLSDPLLSRYGALHLYPWQVRRRKQAREVARGPCIIYWAPCAAGRPARPGGAAWTHATLWRIVGRHQRHRC